MVECFYSFHCSVNKNSSEYIAFDFQPINDKLQRQMIFLAVKSTYDSLIINYKNVSNYKSLFSDVDTRGIIFFVSLQLMTTKFDLYLPTKKEELESEKNKNFVVINMPVDLVLNRNLYPKN